jgi:hypothetical protein
MSTVAFDTLEFVETLKQAGIPENQAKAQSEALTTEIATKHGIAEMGLKIENDLQKILEPIKAELIVVKWMGGIIVGGIILLILKSFFPT